MDLCDRFRTQDRSDRRQVGIRPGRHTHIVQLCAIHLDELAGGGVGFLNPCRAQPGQDEEDKQDRDHERCGGNEDFQSWLPESSSAMSPTCFCTARIIG